MNSSFRPTVETLENRDAPVVLMPVPGLLTLFTIDNPPTFPANPGPATATLVPLHDARSDVR